MLRALMLTFLFLVTQMISITCQDNTGSIDETTATTTSTIFNGSLLTDAKFTGKGITDPSRFTADDSKDVNYEGTDELKDIIQSTRALDNFTTVTAPVTTTLKSENNYYVEEVLAIKQTEINTDDIKQKLTTSDADLNYLTTERTVFAKADDKMLEKESDYIYGDDANFLDEGSGAADISTTTILSNVAVILNSSSGEANSSLKHNENILYDELDEYIYGSDIVEDRTFKEPTTTRKEDLTNLNSTNNPLADVPSSLSTEQVFVQHVTTKQETEIQGASAITEKIPQVKEVTPIEDYESSKSTDSSNLIIQTQDLLTSDYMRTPLVNVIEAVHTSTEENKFHNKYIKEYNEEIIIVPTTTLDPIVSTETNTPTTNSSFPSEIDTSMSIIPTVLENERMVMRNFTYNGVENTSEPNIDVLIVNHLTTVTEEHTESYSTQSTVLKQSTTSVNDEASLGNQATEVVENETDSSASSLISNLSQKYTTASLLSTEQTIVTANQDNAITSPTFVATTHTSVTSMNPLDEETEQIIAEDVVTNHEEFYKQFGGSTDNMPQPLEAENWDDTISVTNYYRESTIQTSPIDDTFETTTTIIDIWLAEENITRNNLNDPITVDITTESIAAKDENTTDFTTVLTGDNATTKTFIQDIISNITTEIKDTVFTTEATAMLSSISTFPTEISTSAASIHNTPQLNTEIKDGDDNFTELEYDFEDFEEVSTKSPSFRKEKQIRDPDLNYVSVETSTGPTIKIEATTSYVEDALTNSQEAIMTNISDIETVTVPTTPEFNLYEDNLTSTIFSKELTDNGQFTADAINILKENNYEVTENQLLNENDQLSTTTEINDVAAMSMTKSYGDEEETLKKLEAEIAGSQEGLLEKTTVKFIKNVSSDDEMKNHENNVDEWAEDVNYNITEAAIEEALNNIENISADNKDNSVLVTSPLSKTIKEKETKIDVIEKLVQGKNLKEQSIQDITDVIKAIVNQTEEASELLEQVPTAYTNEENTTELVHITEEEGNVMQTVSEMRMEDITEEIEKESNKKVNSENIETYQANTVDLGYNIERITEENLFQKDAIITTDSISSMQELDDRNSVTSKRTSTQSSAVLGDPTTKVVISTNEEISTISKINIPFTLVYDEKETFSKHVFKTYIDGTTTESIQVDLVQPISTQNSLLELLSGQNANGIEHTLTDRDTRVNLTTLSETNWNKISLNELSEDKQQEEEETEEEYKEDFEDGDINKLKLLEEELINGNNISLLSNSVSPNYFDEDYTEEYNSSEIYSGNQDDFTSYILTLPERKEDCIQGNISFRIFIGEHSVDIPESFHVFRNASEGLCNVIICWKSDNIENFNNSIIISFEEDQDNYFIKFVEIIHDDDIEVTKSSKDGLMLLATKVGDVMEGSTTIDFENGYQIELTNMNLRLCYNYQGEGITTVSETKPVISNVMVIVICTATTSCLIFLVFAIILCRKLSTKATVYKMTIE